MIPVIRSAEPDDLPLLSALETAADTLLAGLPGFDISVVRQLPAPADVAGLAAARHLLVAGTPPVGFARVEEVDGQAHLEQLSVHPDAAGAGVGRALVAAAVGWAREQGYASMTLCTFAGVPFNAPFYASCGFSVVADPRGGLAELRNHERELGLDALGERVAMRKDLRADAAG
ncbi:GNAT family N-acetyltransferase [Arthrobacter jiangjiafuii]|uniref:GNAT family N-acetyltransferase n=1 Tax=Arthrobacter jiangjiafuii TaxID=2817475 RepID=A0A975M387_9MICC|nr:GNAT family N-acetyltransferase [Arthrobacter jiangjiafuii]MBP3043570.1 GNAT family N-acetyltransferase [Arthrobacter jiangjiafuii]QWC09082.1 GNAT family N-acetyltransferase [Arthrobacter jiangjiafuii]